MPDKKHQPVDPTRVEAHKLIAQITSDEPRVDAQTRAKILSRLTGLPADRFEPSSIDESDDVSRWFRALPETIELPESAFGAAVGSRQIRPHGVVSAITAGLLDRHEVLIGGEVVGARFYDGMLLALRSLATREAAGIISRLLEAPAEARPLGASGLIDACVERVLRDVRLCAWCGMSIPDWKTSQVACDSCSAAYDEAYEKSRDRAEYFRNYRQRKDADDIARHWPANRRKSIARQLCIDAASYDADCPDANQVLERWDAAAEEVSLPESVWTKMRRLLTKRGRAARPRARVYRLSGE